LWPYPEEKRKAGLIPRKAEFFDPNRANQTGWISWKTQKDNRLGKPIHQTGWRQTRIVNRIRMAGSHGEMATIVKFGEIKNCRDDAGS
jgi:hypothetical protein